MKNELQGTWVLVHPDLGSDPLQKQGQIGLVTDVDLEMDDIYVSFGKGQQGLYSTDALLVLKQPGEVYKNTMANRAGMDTADFNTLLNITVHQGLNTPAANRDAIELALDSQTVRDHSLVTLRDKLQLAPLHSPEPELAPARAR